jgi:hypothetical protein
MMVALCQRTPWQTPNAALKPEKQSTAVLLRATEAWRSLIAKVGGLKVSVGIINGPAILL